jgi:hypothetical protein
MAPRRKKPTKKKKQTGATYYKAKNGRFYKKVEIDGKMRVRFVSNAEATGTMTTAPKAKSRSRRSRSNSVAHALATTPADTPEGPGDDDEKD